MKNYGIRNAGWKLAVSFLAVTVLSVYESPAREAGNVATFKIGNATVSVLSEGQQNSNTANLIGTTPEMLKKHVPDGTYPSAVNAFLVQMDGKTILIDAGFGRNLFDNLKSLGTGAEKVDIVLLTHMHGDHIGGLLKDAKLMFPNAELYLPQPEHDYWTGNAERAAQAQAVIAAYRDRLHLFVPSEAGKDAKEIIHGVKGIAAYGHTPGHTGYMFESAGSRIFIWGDLTHAMAVQMPHPEVAITYDVNPEQAVIYRKKLLDYLAENRIPIAGMHIAFPSVGDIKAKDEGYEFTPFPVQ
ncbi:MAG: MBL fold metallo-hydrolase [Prevotellaceae bacterium]|jgi:glyoxylase-like metal-dependent hydrolase (beta-lactamase superfamily II)|nr:MBL fold metallo-hydrolase [Prevotellaceae bacterium]